ERHGQVHIEMIALALEARVGLQGHAEVEIALLAAGARHALAGHAHPRAGGDAGGDLHLEPPLRLLPPAPAAGLAGLAADVPGAAAGRGHLVHLAGGRTLATRG